MATSTLVHSHIAGYKIVVASNNQLAATNKQANCFMCTTDKSENH